MKFEWDEEKNRKNISKHEIDFNEAKTVFYDKNWIKISDDDHTNRTATEDRFYAIGRSLYKNILLVCYCEVKNDIIRIFSARLAKKIEREVYNANH